MYCSRKQASSNGINDVLVMLELVRAALFNREPNISNIDRVDWSSLMDGSSDQGVLAWVWDGICKLPQEQQPPRIQRINWGMSAQEIWDRYRKQEQVLLEMVDICNQNNMRLLLLKGIGLSKYYPKPESRSCGDIDFYLFGDYEKGNELFSNDIVALTGKHAEYDYKGVRIENHFTMLDTDTNCRREIENYLENSLSSVIKMPQDYYLLPPVANLVYLLMHSIRHFVYSQSISYRNIIDFAFFINSNRNELLSLKYKETLRQFDLLESFDLFVYMAEWLLNEDFNCFHLNLIRKKDLLVFRDFIVQNRFLKSKKLLVNSKVIWQKYFILLRFTRYIPRAYNNFVCYITYRQVVAIIKGVWTRKCS